MLNSSQKQDLLSVTRIIANAYVMGVGKSHVNLLDWIYYDLSDTLWMGFLCLLLQPIVPPPLWEPRESNQWCGWELGICSRTEIDNCSSHPVPIKGLLDCQKCCYTCRTASLGSAYCERGQLISYRQLKRKTASIPLHLIIGNITSWSFPLSCMIEKSLVLDLHT